MAGHSRDLSGEMERIYLARLRAMSGQQRLKIAADLSDAVRRIAEAGIKREHPGISDAELREELFKRIYG